ncbi:MAG: hypothetical protein JWO36_2276 [Myxococcales bacterium]|nr:hypothetical protein [Myxococcales bacterium]
MLLPAGCKSKRSARDDAPLASTPRDASTPDAAAWPELASFPHTDPVRVVALPAKPDVPRFDVGGPAVIGDVAIVSSSQFGFIAVDYKRGQIAWTKPAGVRVAPPLAKGGSVVLIGDCLNPPEVPDGQQLLGCVRVVSPTGADEGYVAIHGALADVTPFATSAGLQRVWSASDRTVTWRRGEAAVSVDLVSGVATATSAEDPPLVVHYKERTWEIRQTPEGMIAAREHGHDAWHTSRPYTKLLGAVYLPGQSPMVRASNAGIFAGQPEMNLFDIDATGSLHGQVAFPVPGIMLLGHAIDSVGDVAIAVRLDRSISRDFIVGYAANALIMWVYPLPVQARPDPVGVAITSDAVVVFHDGDLLTILPELSAPPTSPGAARAPLENPTP